MLNLKSLAGCEKLGDASHLALTGGKHFLGEWEGMLAAALLNGCGVSALRVLKQGEFLTGQVRSP